jgi:hypothetical protein
MVLALCFDPELFVMIQVEMDPLLKNYQGGVWRLLKTSRLAEGKCKWKLDTSWFARPKQGAKGE